MDKQWSLALRVILLLLALVVTVVLARSLSWIISLLLISTLIVYILHPLSLYLKNKFRMRHGLATSLVFVLFLLFCIFVFSLLIPVIYFEASEFAESFPHYADRFQEFLSWVSQQTINFEIEIEVKDYLINLSENLHQAVEYLAEASLSLLSGTVDFFLVLFLVFYLLYDFQVVRTRLISIVPLEKRPLAEELLVIVDTNVGTFIRGSLVRCLIVGIATGLVLYFAGMPYSLLLGLLAGIFNFILYLGPYIAAVPAVLLSFSPLTPSPLVVILIYVVIQIMDGMLLAPVVLGRVVKLRPITVIVAILAGGSLAGLLGMVLAVPVAGIIKSLIDLVMRGSAYQAVP
jgi:predicted PurR-regulated permease PerM